MKEKKKMETMDSIFRNSIDWGGWDSNRKPCEESIIEFLIYTARAELIIVRGIGDEFHGAELTDIGWHYGPLMDASVPENVLFADEYKEKYYREDPSLKDDGDERAERFRGLVASYKRDDRYALVDTMIQEKLEGEYLALKKLDGIVEIYWKISGEDFYHEYFYRDENMSDPEISE